MTYEQQGKTTNCPTIIEKEIEVDTDSATEDIVLPSEIYDSFVLCYYIEEHLKAVGVIQ
jgi:hypothetical protein